MDEKIEMNMEKQDYYKSFICNGYTVEIISLFWVAYKDGKAVWEEQNTDKEKMLNWCHNN